MRRSTLWLLVTLVIVVSASVFALYSQQRYYKHEMLGQKKYCELVLLGGIVQYASIAEDLCKSTPFLAGQPNCTSIYGSAGGLREKLKVAEEEYKAQFGDKRYD